MNFSCKNYHMPFCASTCDQIGGGDLPDDTTLTCSRGSDRFANFILFF